MSKKLLLKATFFSLGISFATIPTSFAACAAITSCLSCCWSLNRPVLLKIGSEFLSQSAAHGYHGALVYLKEHMEDVFNEVIAQAFDLGKEPFSQTTQELLRPYMLIDSNGQLFPVVKAFIKICVAIKTGGAGSTVSSDSAESLSVASSASRGAVPAASKRQITIISFKQLLKIVPKSKADQRVN